MKSQTLRTRHNRALKEVHLLRVMSASLGVMVVCFAGLIGYLSLHEKVYVLPPVIKEGFWLSASGHDERYLIQMAEFYTDLMVTANSGNFQFRMNQLQEHIDPDSFNAVKKTLLAQEETIKGGVSTRFAPGKYQYNRKYQSVTIEGVLYAYEGQHEIQSDKKRFKIRFTNRHGRVYIRSFEELK